MALSNEYFPDIVLHPSVTLNEKLKEMGISNKEFAARTNKPEKTIVAVLKGKSSITCDMAVAFENVTCIPAKFWINKQSRYNEYVARKKQASVIEASLDWAKKFPYAEMAKKNWIEYTRNPKERTTNLLNYFGVSSKEGWDSLYMKSDLKVAAYTSLKMTHEPHPISAWLRRGELQAKQITAPNYSKKILKKNIPAMRKLMVEQPEDFFKKLQNLCLQAGVIVVFTPKLPKVPLSGSTRWINNTPLVQLTARYKRNDIFWFMFFHEMGHILLHGKKYISLENINFATADQRKEQEADEFAVELTLTKKQESEVLENKFLTEQDIIKYAKQFDTHPAMIIGRLQHEGKIHYSVGREFIKPIEFDF